MQAGREPNDQDIARLALGVLHREVSMQIGPEGLSTCLRIAGQIQELVTAYQQYAGQVAGVTITLDQAARHLDARVWDAMSNRKRTKFLQAVQKGASQLNSDIQGHIDYLASHKRRIESASPKVQESIAREMAAMQGLHAAEVVTEPAA